MLPRPERSAHWWTRLEWRRVYPWSPCAQTPDRREEKQLLKAILNKILMWCETERPLDLFVFILIFILPFEHGLHGLLREWQPEWGFKRRAIGGNIGNRVCIYSPCQVCPCSRKTGSSRPEGAANPVATCTARSSTPPPQKAEKDIPDLWWRFAFRDYCNISYKSISSTGARERRQLCVCVYSTCSCLFCFIPQRKWYSSVLTPTQNSC